MSEIDSLLEVTQIRFDEIKKEVQGLSEKIISNATLQGHFIALKSGLNRLKQEVAEYRQWKDPKNTEEKMRGQQLQVNDLFNKVHELVAKFNKFESKEWLRVLSDEEIKEQYEKAGKPSMKDIGAKFNVSPENAYNYAYAIVKDPKIRWAFYRFCGGA